MLGRILGHYRIVEKIGAGGMGVVYRARDERLDRDVALKVLPDEMLTDQLALAAFKKEAFALSRLNHPNIATIYDFDRQDGINFLVMEYIQGITLNEKLTFGPLSQKEAVLIGRQLAQGLHSAHSEGVIHRDLKPSNLRLTPDSRVKILDFGLAKLIRLMDSDETQTVSKLTVVGTLPYMSPEQLQGEPTDVRTDIYSAGAVLYEMVTHRRPFADARGPHLAHAIIHEPPLPPMERNGRVTQAMQNIILKALDKNPEQRYQSAKELQVDLERLNGFSSGGVESADESLIYPLEVAHILFMDIVGYSLLPMEEQRHVLRELQKHVCRDSEFTRAKSTEQLISLPTGDGMALVFFGDAEIACKCALQMSTALRDHPEIKLRMGVHTGPVYRVPDINYGRNVAGSGINVAQRVMDCGDSGHILVSKAVADVLCQLSSWSGLIHSLGTTEVKHGVKIELFNLYAANSGNPDRPQKLKLAGRAKSEPAKGKTQAKRRAPRDHARLNISNDRPAGPFIQVKGFKAKHILLLSASVLLLMSAVVLMAPKLRQRVLGFGLGNSRIRTWDAPVMIAPPIPSVTAGVPPLTSGNFLAILPFEVRGDQHEIRSIAQGLDEALAVKLFALQDLRVASSEAIKKTDLKQSAEIIAGRLGVNLLVRGVVENSASGITVTVMLDDVPDKKELLKKPFSGTRSDTLSLEDQIYREIAKSLNLEASETEAQTTLRPPTSNPEAYDRYLKGRAAFLSGREIGNLNTSIGFYEEALKRDPQFALACARLADAHLEMYHQTRDAKWVRKAMDAAKKAQMLNDKLPEAHIALGTVYGEMGQTGEAISQIKRALRLSPKSDEGYRRLGQLYSSVGNSDEAIRAFQYAININPYYSSTYNELGNTYYQTGQYGKALEAFNEVIKLDADNFLGYMGLGNVYYEQVRYPEAITLYLAALRLKSDAGVQTNLSAAYFYLARYPEAIQSGKKAVEMNPNDEVVVGNLAAAYFWSGDKKRASVTYDRAIALANKDLEVNPSDSGTLGDLAIYTAKQGDTQRALYYIGRALKISPNDKGLFSAAAQINVMAGRPDQALESLHLAFENGYPVEQAKLEPELNTLQSNPRFEALVQKLSARKQ